MAENEMTPEQKPPVEENKQEEKQFNNEDISDLINNIQEELKKEKEQEQVELKKNMVSKEELAKIVKDLLINNSKELEEKNKLVLDELKRKNEELEKKMSETSIGSKAGNPNDDIQDDSNQNKEITDEDVLIKMGVFTKEKFDMEREIKKKYGNKEYFY